MGVGEERVVGWAEAEEDGTDFEEIGVVQLIAVGNEF